mgnify:CR=1 FL=1
MPTLHITRHPMRPLILALMTALVGAGSASAQTQASAPWYAGVALGFSHDSNVFRLGDGKNPPSGLVRSDNITTATLLAGFDQPVGRQRVFGSATLRDNRFASNDLLDGSGYAANLGLDWSSIERLSGTLQMRASRDMAFIAPEVGFTVQPSRNVASSRQVDNVVRLGLVSRWQAEVGMGLRSIDYSAIEYASREYDSHWASMGLRYKPSAALSFGVAYRGTRGKYPHYRLLPGGTWQADRFTQRDLDFTATWTVSGASSLSSRLSIERVSFDEATRRDFDGLTGELRWNWQPTGKLRVTTSLLRDTGRDSVLNTYQFITGTDISRTSNALSARADYEITGKITGYAGASYAERALVDTTSTALGAQTPREDRDRTTSLNLGLRWAVSRSLLFSCEWSHQKRSAAGVLSVPYGTDVYGCVGQFVLQ